jgi:hypothetical protein
MFLNYRAPIRAYADRLVCNPGYNGATIHFDAVNPPDSWIVELIVHIAGFHHNGPPISHNPTTHSVEGETGKAESSIAARLDQLIAGSENKAARPIFTNITPSFGVNEMWMQIAAHQAGRMAGCAHEIPSLLAPSPMQRIAGGQRIIRHCPASAPMGPNWRFE